jgi:hypothetical protein
MDGALLVFDSRTLPNLHALAPIAAPLAPKAPWRHRTFPAMAALILASVFSLVYFVSTQKSKHAPASVSSSVSMPATMSNPAAPANSNPALSTEPKLEVSGAAAATKENKPEPTKASTTTTPAAKKAAVKTQTTERKPTELPRKEESKVGSLLKKTGRLLKKPFKF